VEDDKRRTGIPGDLRAVVYELADWLRKSSQPSGLIASMFTIEHTPEPYIIYGSGEPRCYFLWTNPGERFPFQLRPSENSNSLLRGIEEYAEAARRLGAYYASPSPDINQSSRTNIRAVQRLGKGFW
jgi:hypothetical protein